MRNILEGHRIGTSPLKGREKPVGGPQNRNFPFKRKREIFVVETTNFTTSKIQTKIPQEKRNVKALVQAWLEDDELMTILVDKLPTQEDKSDIKFCPFHRKIFIIKR